MKVRDVMTAHPVLATARDADRDRVRRLMEAADVHHVPVVDGDELVGVWAQGQDGSVFLLGSDRVVEIPAEAEAEEAMGALMRDAEVVLVREGGLASGILTRADALAILRTALGRGVGKRHRRPTVIRLVGAGGADTTALIADTLARLPAMEPAVVRTHWRAGLTRAVARLQDAQLILLEDRDEDPDLSCGIGEDLQVAVLTATDALGFRRGPHPDLQAIVVTQADAASAGDVAAAADACRARVPGIPVFAIAHGAGDRGLDDWAAWVERAVRRRRG